MDPKRLGVLLHFIYFVSPSSPGVADAEMAVGRRGRSTELGVRRPDFGSWLGPKLDMSAFSVSLLSYLQEQAVRLECLPGGPPGVTG